MDACQHRPTSIRAWRINSFSCTKDLCMSVIALLFPPPLFNYCIASVTLSSSI